MHTGHQYHEFFLTSPRDLRTRDRFLRLAMDRLPPGADVLDFGAGTGIDAKYYASQGHRTFVYEPSDAMRECLTEYCGDEIGRHCVIPVSSTLACRVPAITANFAVFNHFDRLGPLFARLASVVERGGFILASMLNPWCITHRVTTKPIDAGMSHRSMRPKCVYQG
ncbi:MULTISPECIES: class I SAM-dependent methyltransferase [Dyella]|uniref:Methyltransferase domain-containing protein n=2 Tax=Dyella TaxID=231454 RepID=A0A4R0Z0S2_9GAMM|nr:MULTISPECIES: methyltransferase domain-containing protein [Dyella]TBR39436.1 methyltransferase domain-containing protein [Dyella terrae]TCI12978.1 methyltransferase domain-containing protein [Dyella soli]